MTNEPTPHIRIIGNPVADAEWTDVLEALRRWRFVYGAPYDAIRSMVADDYGVDLTDKQLKILLNGTDASTDDLLD